MTGNSKSLHRCRYWGTFLLFAHHKCSNSKLTLGSCVGICSLSSDEHIVAIRQLKTILLNLPISIFQLITVQATNKTHNSI